MTKERAACGATKRKKSLTKDTPVDKSARSVFAYGIHQGGPDKGLRYCWHSQRSDPLNLIQFILA